MEDDSSDDFWEQGEISRPIRLFQNPLADGDIEGPSSAGEKGTETSTRLEIGKGRKGLQQALMLTNTSEWKSWLQSTLVKPYWIELWDCCLKQQKNGVRGIGLGLIQELLAIGEAGGRRKYSQTFRDDSKLEWEIGDHLACFLYWVKRENLESNEGVFYGRNLADEDMDRAVWALKGILVEMHSPSQINNAMGGKAVFGTVRERSKLSQS
jgi:hypothetical protein